MRRTELRAGPMLVPVGVVAGAVVSLVAVTTMGPSPPASAYAATSSAAELVQIIAGTALVAAGAAGLSARSESGAAVLPAAIGGCWCAALLVGWSDGPAVVRSLAMVAAPFLVPALVHVALALPGALPRPRGARFVIIGAYVFTAMAVVARAAVRDPFLDQYCWDNCTANVFMVSAHPTWARSLDVLWLRATLAFGVLVAAACIARLAAATRPARRVMWLVQGPVALAATAEAVRAVALLSDPAEDPRKGTFLAIFYLRAAALILLAAGAAWIVLRSRWTAHRLLRLADDLGESPPPGALREALQRTLGDDSVDVAYWVPALSRYVDSTGHTCESTGAGRHTAKIVRAGEPVALVHHGEGTGVAALEGIGAATRLAVENERMRASLLAQIDELRASRARIVGTSDETRRRIERDLHDGAQQQLLALSYDLRLALAAASEAGYAAHVSHLTEAAEEVQSILGELRELAHGIFPSILADAGLAAALSAMAVDTAVPVAVEGTLRTRYGQGQEMAAYVAVSDAVAGAARGHATAVRVHLDDGDGELDIRVDHDGHLTLDGHDLVRASDRIGALGGTITVEPGCVRMAVPCVLS